MTVSDRVAPILVMGWGNRSRGDDAIGPLLVDALAQHVQTHWPDVAIVECIDEYQLQMEHAFDLRGRQAVLFIDASVQAGAPFETSAVTAGDAPPAGTHSLSHALSPQTLLGIAQNVLRVPLPPCTLLAIQASAFGLGDGLSPSAQANLKEAQGWAQQWLHNAVSSLTEPQ